MTEKLPPSPLASNGKDSRGRFLPGHKLAKGNPHAKKVAQLRAALLRGVTSNNLRDIIQSLVKAASKGDVAAAKLVLDRTLGPPISLDYEERIERLEALLGDHENGQVQQNRKS